MTFITTNLSFFIRSKFLAFRSDPYGTKYTVHSVMSLAWLTANRRWSVQLAILHWQKFQLSTENIVFLQRTAFEIELNLVSCIISDNWSRSWFIHDFPSVSFDSHFGCYTLQHCLHFVHLRMFCHLCKPYLSSFSLKVGRSLVGSILTTVNFCLLNKSCYSETSVKELKMCGAVARLLFCALVAANWCYSLTASVIRHHAAPEHCVSHRWSRLSLYN